MSSGRSYNLTEQDYQRHSDEAPHVRAAAPVLSRMDISEVSDYGNTNGEVSGVLPQYNQIRYFRSPPAAGLTRTTNRNGEWSLCSPTKC